MTRPLKKPRLEAPSATWLNMVVAYKMQGDCLVMTLRLKTGRVRFQLAPDGVWRRRIKRRGSNYWRKANAWDGLQCRLCYGAHRTQFPKAPRVEISRQIDELAPSLQGHRGQPRPAHDELRWS